MSFHTFMTTVTNRQRHRSQEPVEILADVVAELELPMPGDKSTTADRARLGSGYEAMIANNRNAEPAINRRFGRVEKRGKKLGQSHERRRRDVHLADHARIARDEAVAALPRLRRLHPLMDRVVHSSLYVLFAAAEWVAFSSVVSQMLDIGESTTLDKVLATMLGVFTLAPIVGAHHAGEHARLAWGKKGEPDATDHDAAHHGAAAAAFGLAVLGSVLFVAQARVDHQVASAGLGAASGVGGALSVAGRAAHPLLTMFVICVLPSLFSFITGFVRANPAGLLAREASRAYLRARVVAAFANRSTQLRVTRLVKGVARFNKVVAMTNRGSLLQLEAAITDVNVSRSKRPDVYGTEPFLKALPPATTGPELFEPVDGVVFVARIEVAAEERIVRRAATHPFCQCTSDELAVALGAARAASTTLAPEVPRIAMRQPLVLAHAIAPDWEVPAPTPTTTEEGEEAQAPIDAVANVDVRDPAPTVPPVESDRLVSVPTDWLSATDPYDDRAARDSVTTIPAVNGTDPEVQP